MKVGKETSVEVHQAQRQGSYLPKEGILHLAPDGLVGSGMVPVSAWLP